jgi:metal-responsive CopG/Arc/MetJ family transcriptional regulator
MPGIRCKSRIVVSFRLPSSLVARLHEIRKSRGDTMTKLVNDMVENAMLDPVRLPAQPAASIREPLQPVAISIYVDLLEDLDALVKAEAEITGLSMTRTRVIRRLLSQQLQQHKGK